MLNAYSLRQSILIYEGSDVSNQSIARWTILEQRFPLVAETLSAQPQLLSFVGDDYDKSELKLLSPEFQKVVSNPAVERIVGIGEKDALTIDDIRELARGHRV